MTTGQTPPSAGQADADQRRSERQRTRTIPGLLIAIAATLGVVVLLLLLVPHPTTTLTRAYDVASVAAGAQPVAPMHLVVPTVPKGWTSNSVTWTDKSAGDFPVWYVSFITADHKQLGLTQAYRADQTWVADRLEGVAATGTIDVGGQKFTVYDRRDDDRAPRTLRYSMTGQIGASTIILQGSAPPSDFTDIARQAVQQLEKG